MTYTLNDSQTLQSLKSLLYDASLRSGYVWAQTAVDKNPMGQGLDTLPATLPLSVFIARDSWHSKETATSSDR